MREFFRGTRRKIGGAALMLTLMVAIGWVRSLVVEDSFNLYRGLVFVTSSNGRLWFVWSDKPIKDMPIWMVWKNRDEFVDQTVLKHEIEELKWNKWFGFGYLGFDDTPVNIVIPYWSVVGVLTLFSGWLLLAKRRTEVKNPGPSETSG